MATRNHKRKKAVNGLAGAHHGGSLEQAIAEMARSGELAKAGELAVRRLRRKGIPITYREGNRIIREYSSGRKVPIGRIKPLEFKLPPGVERIEN